MKKVGRKVAVTATTGLASQQYRDFGGTTVHKWAGLNGRFTKEQLASDIQNSEAYIQAKENIQAADVLVIDEIGMLSRKVFDTLEHVVRMVRGSNIIFGGMQVIASGCFKQLPPVPDPMLEDPGDFCFQSTVFRQTFPHHIHLVDVQRQDEYDLVSAVQELCDGCPSDQTDELMKELERPLPPDANPVYLYGTNFEVDLHNHNKLTLQPGELRQFRSIDTG